jgi:hypothetical protein
VAGKRTPAPDPCPLTPAIDAFAKEWRDKQRGKWLEVERLGGFCLLVKRAVLDKIGPDLDEASDLGPGKVSIRQRNSLRCMAKILFHDEMRLARIKKVGVFSAERAVCSVYAVLVGRTPPQMSCFVSFSISVIIGTSD